MGYLTEIIVAAILFLGLACCLGWLEVLSRRLRSRPSLEHLLESLPEGEVKEAFKLLFERQRGLMGRVDRLQAFVERVDRDRAECVRNVALVRYDAFPGVAGKNSFSLALLDDALNGLVFTGISSRADFRAYCKPVTSGRSEVALSPEEDEVLKQAVERRER